VSLAGGYDTTGSQGAPDAETRPPEVCRRDSASRPVRASRCAPGGRQLAAASLPGFDSAPSLDTPTNERGFADEWLEAGEVDRYLRWRDLVRAELVRRDLHSAAARWSMCGDPMPLYCGSGHVKWGAYRCELPICPDCARTAAGELADRWLHSALQVKRRNGYRWRHVMLSIRVGSTQPQLGPDFELSDDAAVESLKSDYGRLLRSWGKLRARWRRRFGDGIAGLASREVGRGMNAHVHVLAYLPYIAQADLSQEWFEITGDSSVVWIREVEDGKGRTWSKASGHQKAAVLRAAVSEACKYVTKIRARDPEQLVTIYEATRGTPRGRPWGALHGRLLPKRVRECACPVCGSTMWFTDESIRFLSHQARPPPDLLELPPNPYRVKSEQLPLAGVVR
jgi:hypothetical protein